MEIVELNDDFFLSKGSERSVYIHPNDKSKVIKILYNQKSKNNQNEMEYKYYKYLEIKQVSFEHITNCYGWECDIYRRYSFNVCDLVITVVIGDSQTNVPKPQTKSEKNQEYPTQL